MHEVFSYGVIAPSTLIELADPYPPPSGYAEIADIRPSIGGEAASSSYVLARLGVATKLSGNRLGRGASSVLDILAGAGVDCSAITNDNDNDNVSELVVSHGEGRTIFGTYGRLLAGRAWEEPSERDIRTARVVNADPFFGNESVAVSRLCRKHGKRYVTVDAPPDSEMAGHAEVVVLSQEYTARTLEITDPAQVVAAYTDRCQGLVVLTRGASSSWAACNGEAPVQHPPFPVEVRDTTGAGDAFRAGIVYGLLHDYTADRMLRLAAAVAALVCQTGPGVLESPTTAEVMTFLTDHP
jgi:sugar/nucleoside kinase (ribokinase family)